MPRPSMALRSNTSTFKPCVLPKRWASSAKSLGVQWLPGRLANSRAKVTPLAMAAPWLKPLAALAACALLLTNKVTLLSGAAAGALGLVVLYW